MPAIRIVPYDQRWPSEFANLAGPLRRQLGSVASRIDHIGSTSISGMAAKDVIDIQVTVNALQAPIAEKMEQLGFARVPNRTDHIPPGVAPNPGDWEKWLFRAGDGMRSSHVHVRVEGRPNQRFPLLFRDYLRFNAAAGEAYARVKRALARLHADDSHAYTEVKDPVCDIILEAAEAWALTTHWSPGPSDA